MTSKFAKYVPEADKKKQREHIGVTWDSLPDKPFGEVVETVSVECDYYNNGSTNTLNIDMSLVPGNVYQIEISKDGEVFDAVSCTAYETIIMDTSAIVLGNAELANGTGGNGESVMIAYAPSHNAYMGAIDGELGDYYIKVTGSVARIKTIDPKYLPSGGGFTDYYASNAKVWHDAECTTAVTKAEVLEAMKSTTIRLMNPPFADLIDTVIAIDTANKWADLYYLGRDADSDSNCYFYKVSTSEWEDPVG